MTASMAGEGRDTAAAAAAAPSSSGFLQIAEECLAALATALASPRPAEAVPAAAAPAPAAAEPLAGPEFWLSLGLDPRRMTAAASGAPAERLSPNATLIAETASEEAGLWRIFHRRRPAEGGRDGGGDGAAAAAAPEFEFVQTIVLAAPVAEFLDQAYRGLLRREPDWDGFTHYTQRLADGRVTRPEILLGMATSDEARGLGVELLIVTTDDRSSSPAPSPSPA